MFIRFDRMYEHARQTDGQIDRQTPHDGIGRARIASHGNNSNNKYSYYYLRQYYVIRSVCLSFVLRVCRITAKVISQFH